MLPDIGPEVVGGSYCPLDGHVNSLALFRALHTRAQRRGVTYLPSQRVENITPRGRRVPAHDGARRDPRRPRSCWRPGNANMPAGPDGRARSADEAEQAARSSSPRRLRPFLNHPVVTMRQTDEGTVMIGDSKEESVDPSGLTIGVSATEAERAVRMFPLLANVNVVRTWSAHPRHDPGRFPDLRRVARAIPAPSPCAAIPASRWPPITRSPSRR